MPKSLTDTVAAEQLTVRTSFWAGTVTFMTDMAMKGGVSLCMYWLRYTESKIIRGISLTVFRCKEAQLELMKQCY